MAVRIRLLCIVQIVLQLVCFSLAAQQRLVDEVKKDMSSLTLTIDNCKSAKKKLQPALSHDDTRGKAETWFVAGRIDFTIYDKLQNEVALGKKINSKEAGLALLSGYDAFSTSLHLDSVPVFDKKGRPVLDKKTKAQKVKTRYSNDIYARLLAHLVDFSAVGGEMYLSSDWENAYRAWDIYCTLAKSAAARQKHLEEPDSTVANYRYYQGMAAYEAGRIDSAVTQFAAARAMGMSKKEFYDTWIDALMAQGDTTYLVAVAHEAYDRFPAGNPRQLRILINHYVRSKDYDTARQLLDAAIARDTTCAECYNLKGHIIEAQEGLNDEAFALYKKAVELDPKFGPGLCDLGIALYVRASALDDKFSPQAQAIFKQALAYMEEAYRLMPRSERVKKTLRQLYYVTGSSKLDEVMK